MPDLSDPDFEKKMAALLPAAPTYALTSDPRIERAARLIAEVQWEIHGLTHQWETVDQQHPNTRSAWIGRLAGIVEFPHGR